MYIRADCENTLYLKFIHVSSFYVNTLLVVLFLFRLFAFAKK